AARWGARMEVRRLAPRVEPRQRRRLLPVASRAPSDGPSGSPEAANRHSTEAARLTVWTPRPGRVGTRRKGHPARNEPLDLCASVGAVQAICDDLALHRPGTRLRPASRQDIKSPLATREPSPKDISSLAQSLPSVISVFS